MVRHSSFSWSCPLSLNAGAQITLGPGAPQMLASRAEKGPAQDLAGHLSPRLEDCSSMAEFQTFLSDYFETLMTEQLFL